MGGYFCKRRQIFNLTETLIENYQLAEFEVNKRKPQLKITQLDLGMKLQIQSLQLVKITPQLFSISFTYAANYKCLLMFYFFAKQEVDSSGKITLGFDSLATPQKMVLQQGFHSLDLGLLTFQLPEASQLLQLILLKQRTPIVLVLAHHKKPQKFPIQAYYFIFKGKKENLQAVPLKHTIIKDQKTYEILPVKKTEVCARCRLAPSEALNIPCKCLCVCRNCTRAVLVNCPVCGMRIESVHVLPRNLD